MAQSISQSWSVSENDFPRTGTATEKLRFLLNYAVLAPSRYNTQPWLFKVRGDMVELYADRTRSLPRLDPDDRELIMSCGAALLHLRLALHCFGYAGILETFPDADDEDLLARVALGPQYLAAPQEQALFRMIPRRHTNRLPFTEQAVPDKLLCLLQLMAHGEGAWLCLVGDENARDLLADLVETGDRIRWADKLTRYELAAWMHPHGHASSDGVPGSALDPDDILGYADPTVIRTVNLGAEQAAKDRRLVMNAPVLAVLGTDADGPTDWLAAGQALERVLLCACAVNICASFLSQPTASPVLRKQLHQTMSRVLGKPVFPQLVLRLGYGPEVQPTPRRAVDEVTF